MGYAIFKTGGKQYRVAEGDVIEVEKLDVVPGTETTFSDVLFYSSGSAIKSNAAELSNAKIVAEIISQDKAPKVVAFDVLFPTPKSGDEAFEKVLEKHHDQVVVAGNFQDAETSVGGMAGFVPPSPLIVPPGSALEDSVGFVNFRGDPFDHVVRKIRYQTTVAAEKQGDIRSDSGKVLYSLGARVLQKAGFSDRIPAGLNLIRFRFAREKAFPVHSVYEIFVKNIWDNQFHHGEFFKNKIVVVGPMGNWSKDDLNTPFGKIYGVLLHLHTINAALNRDMNQESSAFFNGILILLSGLGAWILAVTVSQPFIRFFLIAGGVFGMGAVESLEFNSFSTVLNLFPSVVVWSASGITCLAWGQLIDRMERARTRRTLERYVSRDVAGEVLDNPESYLNSLGGVRKSISILFSDIRGFTTMSESSDPHDLVMRLNEYFNRMVGIVFANHGTLDKFIGDAIMAHWGSIQTESPETNCSRAITAAVQMRKALVEINEDWKKRGIRPISIGIGINYGEVVVGNLGCEAKMEVSAIGDSVNLASRLEGVTKKYHLDLIVGEGAADLVRDRFLLRFIDSIVVQGKSRPVRVYTIPMEGDVTNPPEWFQADEKAMEAYRSGDFQSAEAGWREVLRMRPDDGPAAVFIERCIELQKNPPGPDWNGVFTMKSK